jgi:hypothetical protein
VHSDPYETELIGKEGSKIEERQIGEVTEAAEYRNHYGRRTSTWLLVLSVLQEIGAPEIAWQSAISRSAVYEVLRGAQPRSEHAREYETAALRFARQRLERWEVAPLAQTIPALTRYLDERAARGEDVRRCAWDGKPIPRDRRVDARFCSDRCRKAARRSDATRPSGSD